MAWPEYFLNLFLALLVPSSILLSMMSTNMICWNYRGISNVNIVNRVQDLIHNHKPVVVCLVETRADEPRVLHFCRKFNRSWEWVAVPAIGMSRGIIVLWKETIGWVSPVAVTKACLHLVISPTPNDSWVLSIIYNGCTLACKRSMWAQLSGMSNLELPWLLIGDFNSIVSSDKHRGLFCLLLSQVSFV